MTSAPSGEFDVRRWRRDVWVTVAGRSYALRRVADAIWLCEIRYDRHKKGWAIRCADPIAGPYPEEPEARLAGDPYDQAVRAALSAAGPLVRFGIGAPGEIAALKKIVASGERSD